MAKILSMLDYQFIEETMDQMKIYATDFDTSMNKMIDLFENNDIVQQFYASGKYGANIKERLAEIRLAVQEYMEIISVGQTALIPQTNQYVHKQAQLLSRTKQAAKLGEPAMVLAALSGIKAGYK